MTTANTHMAQVDKVLTSYLLTGLADLISLVVRPMYLGVSRVTVIEKDLTWCKELQVQDHSLCIDDHAAVIRNECGDKYNVETLRGVIYITVKS
jgi:hypothetical protein